MAQLRTLVLEVAEDKADELIEALRKRSYINLTEMTREGRKSLRECPACQQKLAREMTHTVTEEMVNILVSMVEMMSKAKSVILTHKGNPRDQQPPMEQERCIEVRSPIIDRAEKLGLIQSFEDGSRSTHFITSEGLQFLSGKEPLDPGTIVVLNGKVIASLGTTNIDDVRFKDRARKDLVLRKASRAVRVLPIAVLEFVQRGQMTLI